MVKKTFYSVIAVFISCFLLVVCHSCGLKDKNAKDGVDIQCDTLKMQDSLLLADTLTALEHLLEKGVLVAVTNCEDFNYKMYKAHPSGFEYDLLKDFCKMNQLRLEMKVNDNLDSCFLLLDSGEVDVIATGVGLTKELREHYGLTDPIFTAQCVLVQRMPKNWSSMSTDNEVENQLLRSPLDLAEKTIHVSRGNYAVKVLEHLSEEIGKRINVVECDTLNDFELISAVCDGKIDYTVVDDYIATAGSYGLKGLDTKLVVGVEHPIGWVVKRHDDDSSLLTVFNDWIDKAEQKQLRIVMTRYVKNRRLFAQKPEEANGHISPFDKAIKKTAAKIGWDWRLLAALIYQESRFKVDLESDKGAFGLMQLMPSVMQRYNVSYDSSPEEQLEAGGKLISYLDKTLQNKVADSLERVKFVLAAYNAGLGHVLDAQRLAMKYEKAPDVWENNVDYFILNKSKPLYYRDTCCRCGFLRGTQTYRFVEEIMERYHHYQNLVD